MLTGSCIVVRMVTNHNNNTDTHPGGAMSHATALLVGLMDAFALLGYGPFFNAVADRVTPTTTNNTYHALYLENVAFFDDRYEEYGVALDEWAAGRISIGAVNVVERRCQEAQGLSKRLTLALGAYHFECEAARA